MLIAHHFPSQSVGPDVDKTLLFSGIAGRIGDDQRRASLVDENAVRLVDQGEIVVALHLEVGLFAVMTEQPWAPERLRMAFRAGDLEAIAQKVEAKLARC